MGLEAGLPLALANPGVCWHTVEAPAFVGGDLTLFGTDPRCQNRRDSWHPDLVAAGQGATFTHGVTFEAAGLHLIVSLEEFLDRRLARRRIDHVLEWPHAWLELFFGTVD